MTKRHRVLAFSCTHSPFIRNGYIEFLQEVYKRFKCDTVVHLGDEIDHHVISFHDAEPDAMGAMDEYESALDVLEDLYKAFPNVKVCSSNHTMRHLRKGAKVGIPAIYFKGLAELLEAPRGWKWADSWEIDGVLYVHAEGYSGKVPHKDISKDRMQSVVIGHPHTIGGVEYTATDKSTIFGMSVGCGIDDKAYAFRYAKHMKHKSLIGCGVVLEGQEAIFVPMPLGKKRGVK